MADYTPPLRDIRFVLDAVLKVKDRWSQWPALAEVVDGETADAILEEAGKLCAHELAPLNRNSDEEGCHWQAGEVTTPQGFRQAYQAFAEG
uniref:acyl-CoA dehydrogenase N-terminal domain-containing protein n=1 Tax=Pseudomonas oryzihabitans TaxID=47885 RepID=UPI0028A7EBD3